MSKFKAIPALVATQNSPLMVTSKSPFGQKTNLPKDINSLVNPAPVSMPLCITSDQLGLEYAVIHE